MTYKEKFAAIVILLLILLAYSIAASVVTSDGPVGNYIDLGETFTLIEGDLQYTCQIMKDADREFVVNCLEAMK